MPATTTSSADLASAIFASGAADAEVIRSLSLQPRILYATPEMSDFVKTGGLGEVAHEDRVVADLGLREHHSGAHRHSPPGRSG